MMAVANIITLRYNALFKKNLTELHQQIHKGYKMFWLIETSGWWSIFNNGHFVGRTPTFESAKKAASVIRSRG
jgi:hypothetical protein